MAILDFKNALKYSWMMSKTFNYFAFIFLPLKDHSASVQKYANLIIKTQPLFPLGKDAFYRDSISLDKA